MPFANGDMHKLCEINPYDDVEIFPNNLKNKECYIGGLVEISVENEPILIQLDDGSIIWSK